MWSRTSMEAALRVSLFLALCFALSLSLATVVRAQSTQADSLRETRNVLERAENRVNEVLQHAVKPDQIPGEFRRLWGPELESVDGFQEWFYFFLPYAIRTADTKVDGLEDLLKEIRTLQSNLENTPNVETAAYELRSAAEWADAGTQDSSYIPPEDWSEWVLAHVPMSEEIWKEAVEFTQIHEVERRWMDRLDAALEKDETNKPEVRRMLVALKEKNEYIFSWGKSERLQYLFRQYDSLENKAKVAAIRTNWQEATARRNYKPPYRRDEIFEIVGSGARQGVRRTDTRAVILPRSYEIWQIASPVIIGRDREVLVWNLRGQLLGASTAAVEVSFGNDLETLHLFEDENLQTKRFVYVPERGALLRFARIEKNPESLDQGIAPIDYLVVDEKGLPVGQGSGFWRFAN